jgi:hypothetical protein
MPSGFQQDSNQLSPAFYRVVWVASTGTYATADGNDNGAITPNSADSFSTLPTTLIKGKARARGNMRFRNVVNRLSGLADCQILDIETGISGGGPETAGDDQVTSLAFTVRFDRDAGIVDAVLGQIGTAANNGADGAADITSAFTVQNRQWAVKDQFVRGFRDATTAMARVYDGGAGEDRQLSITVAAPDSAADIWADTTVTLVDGTEIVTLDSSGAAE